MLRCTLIRNRSKKCFRTAEIYVPWMCRRNTSPSRAAASKLASIIPAVPRHDSRLHSRCHVACGRHRSSSGCCSAGSAAGSLAEDRVCHSSTLRLSRYESTPARLWCMVVRRVPTMSASVHCVRYIISLCCAGERIFLSRRAAIERCGKCLYACLFVPSIANCPRVACKGASFDASHLKISTCYCLMSVFAPYLI